MLSAKRVVILSTDRVDRLFLAALLKSINQDIKSKSLSNLKDARSLLRTAKKIDLIIISRSMAEKEGGIRFLQKIRSAFPKVPLIYTQNEKFDKDQADAVSEKLPRGLRLALDLEVHRCRKIVEAAFR